MLNQIQIPIVWPTRGVISDKQLLSRCSDARAKGNLPGEEDLTQLNLAALVDLAGTHGLITTVGGWKNWSR